MLIGDILRRQAAPTGRPHHPAIIHEGGATSFADLHDTSMRVAHSLIDGGARPGDRVALLGRNSPEWVATYYGAALAGVILVPVNFWFRANEVEYALNDSGATVVLADRNHAPVIVQIRDSGHAPDVRHWVWLDEVAAVGSGALPADLAVRDDALPSIDEDAAHIILYTSGTTGFPKGAVLSHRAHVLHATTFALHVGAHPGDTYLNVYPLFHTGGTDCALLPFHIVGATVVIMRDPRPDAILDAIAQHRVTAMMAVPTIWRRLVDTPGLVARDLASFRRAMGSSDAMPLDLLREVITAFGASWTQTYGLTEAGCILTYLPPDDFERKVGSAGKPHAQADLFVADPSRDGEADWPLGSGHCLPAGIVGEVVARTEHLMSRYWGKPDQTEAAIRHGFLRTGDLGTLDDDGYLYIAGRLKDVIISGGEKIYPAEVEPTLRTYPGVRDLALVGVPDREWGESVLAAIVPEAGHTIDADDFRRWARAHVAGFKAPRHVAVVDDLPRTTGTGKVQKAALRDRFRHLGNA
jgi:acyl-CoA synthetase (AMP-forming)/AMP-acid ligase II